MSDTLINTIKILITGINEHVNGNSRFCTRKKYTITPARCSLNKHVLKIRNLFKLRT